MTKRYASENSDGDRSKKGSGRHESVETKANRFLTDICSDPDLVQLDPALSQTLDALFSTRQKISLHLSLPNPKPRGKEGDLSIEQKYTEVVFPVMLCTFVRELIRGTLKKARLEDDEYQLSEEERVEAYMTFTRWSLHQLGVPFIPAQVTPSHSATVATEANRSNKDHSPIDPDAPRIERGHPLVIRAKNVSFMREINRLDEDDPKHSQWQKVERRCLRKAKEAVGTPYIELFGQYLYNYLEGKVTEGQRRFLSLLLLDPQYQALVDLNHQGETFTAKLRELVYGYMVYAYRMTYLKKLTEDFVQRQGAQALKALLGTIPELDQEARVIPAQFLRKTEDNIQQMVHSDPILSCLLNIYRRFPDVFEDFYQATDEDKDE